MLYACLVSTCSRMLCSLRRMSSQRQHASLCPALDSLACSCLKEPPQVACQASNNLICTVRGLVCFLISSPTSIRCMLCCHAHACWSTMGVKRNRAYSIN